MQGSTWLDQAECNSIYRAAVVKVYYISLYPSMPPPFLSHRQIVSDLRIKICSLRPLEGSVRGIHFLSAKPVRAAFARKVLLAKNEPDPELTSQLQAFIDRDFKDYIVVSVGIEVQEQRMAAPLMRVFIGAQTADLQKNVYLERKDGKKLYLMEYRPPVEDGMGAKFVFPRMFEGQPFLTENDSVRFVAQVNEKMKLNTRYKVSEMMYDGKLEY